MTRLRELLKSRRNRWIVIGVLLTVLYLANQQRAQIPVVKVTSAARGSLSLTIAASGRVDGDASDLGFNDNGRVEAIYVQEGERVEPNQALARISLGAVLGDSPSGTDVIRAPYPGQVVQIYRREGSSVQMGSPVLRIVRSDSSWVTAFIDSEDAGWLQLGQRMTVRAGGYLARPWDVAVESIGSEAVQREDVPGSSRQVRVRLRLVTSGFDLPVGTPVDVDGDVPMVKDALLVPAGAVTRLRGKTYLWRVHGLGLQKAEVRTGANNFRQIVIQEGIAVGDVVVVEGKSDMKEGEHVRTVEWKEAGAS